MFKELVKNTFVLATLNIAPYLLGKNWSKIKASFNKNKIVPLTLHK